MDYFAEVFSKIVSRLTGRNFLIMSDASDRSLFDFESRSSDAGGCEYFGLGLHVIVTPVHKPLRNAGDMSDRANADK